MPQRNRAEGWRHAKLSGHKNEDLIEYRLEHDELLQQSLLSRLGLKERSIQSIRYGGLCERNVPCILGGTTKSKTDVYLTLDDGTPLNISVKKSAGGQVYLIGDERFIRGFEAQYRQTIPPEVTRAIQLYWGSAPDTVDIARAANGFHLPYELHKHRLTAESLYCYNPRLVEALLDWFTDNMPLLLDFCFSRGLAADPNDWANVVWYINELEENDMDLLVPLASLQDAEHAPAQFGTRTGGSTIQLSFGFVQWHQGKLQFHHSYDKLCGLLE